MQSSDSSRLSARILAGCCVPWTESFDLDEHRFRELIRGNIRKGFHSLYLFGTAGEGYAVTGRQFERIARIFADETEGKSELRQVGVIALSLPQVQERIDVGISLGFSDYQLSFPSWGKLNDREVDNFFQGTCDRYPGCRFLFYNLPRGLRMLTAPELSVLADRHPNLIAVKWAGRWQMSEIRAAFEAAPQLCHFFGDVNSAMAGLEGLSPSLLIALSATHYRRAHEIFQLVQTGSNPERLKAVLEDLQRQNQIFRDLPMTGRIDGAYDKMICKLHLPDFPLRLLPPYEGASEEVFQMYKSRMQAELPHWLEPPCSNLDGGGEPRPVRTV